MEKLRVPGSLASQQKKRVLLPATRYRFAQHLHQHSPEKEPQTGAPTLSELKRVCNGETRETPSNGSTCLCSFFQEVQSNGSATNSTPSALRACFTSPSSQSHLLADLLSLTQLDSAWLRRLASAGELRRAPALNPAKTSTSPGLTNLT